MAAQRFEPDFIVTEAPADARRAYDALEKGSDVTALVTDHPDKLRNDEASLAHDRAPDSDGDDTDGSPSTEEPESKPKAAPTDAALQRAIHVYQGLRAMKVL